MAKSRKPDTERILGVQIKRQFTSLRELEEGNLVWLRQTHPAFPDNRELQADSLVLISGNDKKAEVVDLEYFADYGNRTNSNVVVCESIPYHQLKVEHGRLISNRKVSVYHPNQGGEDSWNWDAVMANLKKRRLDIL